MFSFNSLQRMAGAGLLATSTLSPPTGVAPDLAARFVDLIDHPTQEANWERFHALEDRLADAFHGTCGEGGCVPRRFLWPMQLRCSVQVDAAAVVACIWVIAGSDLKATATGHIDAEVRVWRCVLPMPRSMPVERFHSALDVPAPLSVRLPGASATLRQGLQDCLAAPGSRT